MDRASVRVQRKNQKVKEPGNSVNIFSHKVTSLYVGVCCLKQAACSVLRQESSCPVWLLSHTRISLIHVQRHNTLFKLNKYLCEI